MESSDKVSLHVICICLLFDDGHDYPPTKHYPTLLCDRVATNRNKENEQAHVPHCTETIGNTCVTKETVGDSCNTFERATMSCSKRKIRKQLRLVF